MLLKPTPLVGPGGPRPLYYCHSCGVRLRAAEAAIAQAHREAHHSACCQACARKGQRIADPAAYEEQLSLQNPAPSSAGDWDEGSEETTTAFALPPIVGSSPSAVYTPLPPAAPRRPSGRLSTSSRTGVQMPTWLLAGGGAAILAMGLLILFLFLNLRAGPPGERPGPGRQQAGDGGPRGKPKPITLLPPQKENVPVTPREKLPPPPVVVDEEVLRLADLAALCMERGDYMQARQRLEELRAKLPPQLAQAGEWREKLDRWAADLPARSKARLDEALKAAEAAQTKGDWAALRELRGRARLLLPEQAKEYNERTAGMEEAALAEARRKLEALLPAAGGLPRGQGLVLFGPEPSGQGLKWVQGGKARRQAPGKVDYLDGTQALEFSGDLKSPPAASFKIAYLATQDCQVQLSVNLAQWGWRTVTATLSATGASVATYELKTDRETLKVNGDTTGRAISGFKLSSDGLPPWSLAIVQIYE